MDLKYFSGSQTSLFIGNIWVDDIDSINYSIKSSKSPIYGYGSTHFDFVTKGSVLVQGNFSINFREPNYLWAVLKHYESFRVKSKNTLSLRENKGELKVKEAERYIEDQNTFLNDPRSNFDYFFNSSTPNASIAAQNLRKQRRDILDIQNEETNEKFHHDSFNILIGFGDKLDSTTTGELISGVHLLEKAKTIVSDGRPIKEVYSFIARKID
jgi:hypothetical protein